ncbi:hypothetical protein HK099_007628 [Clydaea vesicula]|uniref:Uncharacterized protein n=1 Tax=Clydaea vesicula TaxID=447962 RepID=A0AAD5TZU1_9FUNG|nr:hypothetical protein HK099_007628 [Clydaea vesicula]
MVAGIFNIIIIPKVTLSSNSLKNSFGNDYKVEINLESVKFEECPIEFLNKFKWLSSDTSSFVDIGEYKDKACKQVAIGRNVASPTRVILKISHYVLLDTFWTTVLETMVVGLKDIRAVEQDSA